MAMEDRFDQRLDDVEERSEHLVPRVVGGLKRADERLVALVQERPVVVLGAALAAGYLLGRIVSSR